MEHSAGAHETLEMLNGMLDSFDHPEYGRPIGSKFNEKYFFNKIKILPKVQEHFQRQVNKLTSEFSKINQDQQNLSTSTNAINVNQSQDAILHHWHENLQRLLFCNGGTRLGKYLSIP